MPRTRVGWLIQIDDRLLTTNPEETEKAVELLTPRLEEIVRVVPPGPVADLRKVTLWLSPPHPGVERTAAYHPSVQWLRAHDRNPAMAKGVEFTHIPAFEHELQRMPSWILHELAHAYHDRVLGYENAEVIRAYKDAKASGKYAHVERWNGPGRPTTFEVAYAMTDPREYFAESTEAFFGRNDFYPFTRDDLAKVDPEMCSLLERLWQTTPVPQEGPPLKKP